MVHWFVVGVEYCPCKLFVGVVILVGKKFRKGGSCWWNSQVWSDRDGLQDWVVSGVADWCFGEYFDQGVQSGQVDVGLCGDSLICVLFLLHLSASWARIC